MKLYSRIYEAKCKPEEIKEDIIILHGLFGISDNWVGFARQFSKYHRIIIPDLRNHGQSFHNDSFELDDLVADLLNVINDNNSKSPILLGHSLGGRIAMRFALLYPELISKLIVVDISLRSVRKKPEHIAIINIMKSFPIDEMKSLEQIKDYLLKNIKHEKLRRIVLKNILKTSDSFQWKVYFKPLIKLFDKESEAIATDQVFEKETLFIRGGNSDYILDSDIAMIKEHFPNSEIKTIEGASHWVQADKPLEFIKTVISFIDKK